MSGGLTFTDEAARHLKSISHQRTLLRSGSRQFGTSTYLPVKKSWILDVVRVFFAKE